MTVLKLSQLAHYLAEQLLLEGDCEIIVEFEDVRAMSWDDKKKKKTFYDASDVVLRPHNTRPGRKVINFSNLTSTAAKNNRKRYEK